MIRTQGPVPLSKVKNLTAHQPNFYENIYSSGSRGKKPVKAENKRGIIGFVNSAGSGSHGSNFNSSASTF